MTPSIPVVDLGADDLVEGLGRALAEVGFVAITGHGIDLDLVREGYATAARLFALPLDAKRRYETPGNGRQRGYTSFGVEHAKDVVQPDLKEFWHVGRKLPADHPLRLGGEVPPNLFPRELPAARIVFQRLFDQVEDFANRLLDAYGSYLGVPEGFFRAMVRDGNSVMRLIHYPELGDGTLGGSVRAAAHEDINLLTVLPWSPQGGLQIQRRDGSWFDVRTPPDVMICDTGDMMALLTGIPATTHRVVNPLERDESRYSMPFFLHPHPEATLAPLAGGEAVLARDFLRERLEAIGVAWYPRPEVPTELGY